MRIDILSCVPELLVSPLNHSILKRAQEKKILEVFIHNLRDYTTDKHRTVDDYPYGGGPGMVLMAPPLAAAIKSLSQNIHYDEIIYLTPDGETFNQKMANQLSLKKKFITYCWALQRHRPTNT